MQLLDLRHYFVLGLVPWEQVFRVELSKNILVVLTVVSGCLDLRLIFPLTVLSEWTSHVSWSYSHVINICVSTIRVQHSDGLVELRGMDFPFRLTRLFIKTFLCLTVWPPIISWRFFLHLNAVIGVTWNTPWNSMLICKIFQSLFTILDILESVLLYIVDSGVLFLSFFSLLVNSFFLSILSTCSSRTSPLYCRPWNFCLTIAQFLSNSVVVEQIVFSLETWPYEMLLFRDLACYDLACKNACWCVDLWYKVVWMSLFPSLSNIASRNAIFLGETWKSNLIVLCSFV